MGRRRTPARGSQLLEKGVLATLLGCAFLFAPLVLQGSPILRTVAQALKIPGLVALGLGLALVAADQLTKRIKATTPNAQRRSQAGVLPGSKDMFPPELPPAPGKPDRSEVRGTGPTSPTSIQPPGAKRQSWDKQVFHDIEWRRFEAVCERLFAQAGFQATSQSHGADGGVDIWVHSRHSEGPAAVVQCKHWVGRPVGVKDLREFFGVMASKSVKRGTFATSSTFTPAASAFAKENGINILDGDGLLALIARRSEGQRQELLAVAYEGEYWRPTCASCGVKLVDRTATKDSTHFWGCVNFPRCRTTMAVRAA